MSDSNRIRVSIVAETTFGETPATPAFLVLPTTGQSMRDRVGYQQSQTIRNDRNVKDLIRLSKSAGGGLPCELTYSATTEALFLAIRAVLCSSGEVAERSEAAATTSIGTSTVTKAAIDFTAGNPIEVGDIVKVTGGSADGFYKVSAVAATTVTLEGVTWLSTSAGVVTITRGARMKNGTTERSFSIEVARTDEDIAQIFTGCTFDAMDFNIADEAITTANFSVVAASSTRVDAPVSGTGSSAIYVTGATYTDPTSYPVLDSIGVPEIKVAGSDYAAKSVAMTLANNVAGRTQIGALGPQSMRYGTFVSSGRVVAYMDGFDDFDDFADNTATDLWLAMVDSSNRGWTASWPQAKFSDAGADTRGLNQDDYKELSLTAFLDPTELCTVRWQRWVA